MPLDHHTTVGVLGAGTMGSGIAQVAATAGHRVVVADTRPEALDAARNSVAKALARDVEKNRLSGDEAKAVAGRLSFVAPGDGLSVFAHSGLVIEAIVEDLTVKRDIFRALDTVAPAGAVLAT